MFSGFAGESKGVNIWKLNSRVNDQTVGWVYVGGAFKIVGVKQYQGRTQELNSDFALIRNDYENLELVEDCDREEGDADSE